MIRSLLIANRGEIARRIIRTAREMGIRTVAVHSDVDAGLPFVREADVAICIGPAPARESYLDQDKVLAAARESGAEAIHPGYGFLSENAEFADKVIAAGLVWVGAPPSAIRAMGLKDAAKALMTEAGVPVTPGYLGEDQDPERLRAEADAIGYPILIKAVAGGGGKGMRRVDYRAEFADALLSCQREATSAFGDDRVLIEKYVLNPRHIEVQVFGDTHGNVVHLFERDCSLQRRHQKVIEEAPAPGMDEETRTAICDAAVRAAKAVDYVGAGTIEFIADASDGLRADRIWFMEMNTRLQVEHPVTEAITGQDLVEWQLRVASGEALPLRQEELGISGWAIEARLYAEDPANNFLPSIGRLERLQLPLDRCRVDSGIEQGDEVSPFYDPMVGKIIVAADDREVAIDRLGVVLGRIFAYPVKTNAGFLRRLVLRDEFYRGGVDTGFIAQHLEELTGATAAPEPIRNLAATTLWMAEAGQKPILGRGLQLELDKVAQSGPWMALVGFRLSAASSRAIPIEENGSSIEGEVCTERVPGVRLAWAGDTLLVNSEQGSFRYSLPRPDAPGKAAAGDGSILAPMPGRIVTIDVTEGVAVTAGQKLVVLEAMKMEQALTAPFDGRVTDVHATVGSQVTEGTLLVRVEPAEG